MHRDAAARLKAGMAAVQEEASAILSVPSAYERPDRFVRYSSYIRVDKQGPQLVIRSGWAYMPRPTVAALEEIGRARQKQLEPGAV